MADFMDYAYPAGDESDASNEEWDIGHYPDKKSSCIQELDASVPHAEDNVSKLKQAISKGDVATVEQLLDDGVDVETRLRFEWTPLMAAVSVANYDLAKLLLDKGASANFSKDHFTVLMASCTASASEDKIARCVELLLSRNADPNMVDRSQMTCLTLAARNGYSKVINILVSHRANINAQDDQGYTALSVAVQYGREEAVLKLLQLGADKNIKTETGKRPADLAEMFKHTQIARILASSSDISTFETFSSKETLSKFFKTNSEVPPSKDSVTRLADLELLLHGLDLGYLVDIMTENDISWNYLLTMEKEDLEKIGVTDPVDQQKLLNSVQQMHLDKVDTFTLLEAADSGSEELQNFIISVRQQCCYLTEMIQDTISRLPRQPSQLVFSLDPKKEARAICNQLVLQTKDLQKEIICLRNLLSQVDTHTL
ncbi:ankyrin repeat, SAM and basic leucine zipper domain-containing protein 1 [Acanthochromis polyacanthus]|uniref:ankyrin repeat, SAM and basic leucine zipper domain-containing protein 1 n=1 Tax=Acanthochromis polyacanthus TaxID=80966 RepID=UPI0022342872|nr:ankyrin repeat, SAM and basic leucine zipper domain-containing protein 1 [Acanthochromis polyacanthus]